MTELVVMRIRDILEREIAAALGESSIITNVNLSEVETEQEAYSVIGTFRVTPLFSYSPTRKGKFNSKLDKNLKLLSLKIQEETK